jgi:2-dehydropantoate 2-reductase
MLTQTIQNIYIVGLGAIGTMYASKFQEIDPEMVKIIAQPDRVERYKDAVFTINGKVANFEFVLPGTHAAAADLIIVAVKSAALQQAIADLKGFVGPHTIILSLLNGMGSEEQLAEAVGAAHILHSYAVGMDAVRKQSDLQYSNIGRIVFGDQLDGPGSAKVQAVKALFDRVEIPYLIPEDIERSLWTKFMMNVGINQVSAVLRAPYGAFQRDQYAIDLMTTAFWEVIHLSEKAGINLTESDINHTLKIIETLSPSGKTSMLQDIEAQRLTEVDIFAGKVMALGKTYGFLTPVNEALYNIIKYTEANYNK